MYTARGLLLTARTARAQFWLQLRDQFSRHDAVHQKLRPGGEWSESQGAPNSAAEWTALESYMGLFEHREVMLADGLIDEKTFESIYAYRLRNIVSNQVIVREKLVERRQGWMTFIALLRRMSIEVPAQKA